MPADECCSLTFWQVLAEHVVELRGRSRPSERP
jgi:hypothetical protein